MSLVNDDGRKVSTVPSENDAALDGKMSLEHLLQFGLPALQQRLREQEGHLTKARRRHERAAKMNNDAFEAWDDYCTTVLGAESDALPLFPELAEGTDVDAAIDAYAIDVGRAAAGPLRREWGRSSGRFVRCLTGADGSEGEGAKCYGREIAEAVEYYRQFRRFVGAASGALDDNTAGAADELLTLHSYVSNGEQQPSASESESLLEQFTTSPTARAALVCDLHRLEAFLSARTRELSARSTQMRSGREVANEVELQWTQHCLRVGSALDGGISPDEVARHRDAVRAVVAQIAGDSVNARRLRFLADAVGRPAEEDARAGSQFWSTCREAARMAYRMNFCQDGQERSAKMVERCVAAMDATKEEISRTERRIDCLREGVGEPASK
ncbi:hypothetical protein ACHAXT_001708 [Thalassiosira profunda]